MIYFAPVRLQDACFKGGRYLSTRAAHISPEYRMFPLGPLIHRGSYALRCHQQLCGSLLTHAWARKVTRSTASKNPNKRK